MIVKDNDGSEFEKLRKTDQTLVVEYGADWCGPCRALEPVLEKLSEKYTDFTFIKIDVDIDEKHSLEFSIRSVPTVQIWRNRKVYTFVGAKSALSLDKMLSEIDTLKYEEVLKSDETI